MHITKRGVTYHLEGVQPKTGMPAPDFHVKNLEDESKTLKDFEGQTLIISVVPDIDTRVCSLQTKQFNQTASELEGIQLVTISNNQKEQQKSWCAAEGINMEMLHDTALDFARAYGVYMPEMEKLARSVFVVDGSGQLVYQEIVPEMTEEPDYQAAITAAKDAK